MRNRASVLLNWAWSYLTWDRGPRLILGADIPAFPAGDTGTEGGARGGGAESRGAPAGPDDERAAGGAAA